MSIIILVLIYVSSVFFSRYCELWYDKVLFNKRSYSGILLWFIPLVNIIFAIILISSIINMKIRITNNSFIKWFKGEIKMTTGIDNEDK